MIVSIRQLTDELSALTSTRPTAITPHHAIALADSMKRIARPVARGDVPSTPQERENYVRALVGAVTLPSYVIRQRIIEQVCMYFGQGGRITELLCQWAFGSRETLINDIAYYRSEETLDTGEFGIAIPTVELAINEIWWQGLTHVFTTLETRDSIPTLEKRVLEAIAKSRGVEDRARLFVDLCRKQEGVQALTVPPSVPKMERLFKELERGRKEDHS